MGNLTDKERLDATIMVLGCLLAVLQKKDPTLRSKLESELVVSHQVASRSVVPQHRDEILKMIANAQRILGELVS